jgi:leucyl/phenylalanyl-tRNA--protein transferase
VRDGLPSTDDRAGPLVPVGGELEAATLAAAYWRGIFPWPPGNAREAADLQERFGAAVASGAIPNLSPDRPAAIDLAWWSPDPRAVIPLDSVHVSRSLRRTLRLCGWTSTVNQAFRDVAHECGHGRDSAWITPPLLAAYVELHDRGWAHSIEVWDGVELVGGMYGVLVGGVFMGESMFHRRADASKVALSDMASRLVAAGAILLDTQFVTPHLQTMGAVEIPRACFLATLADTRAAELRLETDRRPVARLG